MKLRRDQRAIFTGLENVNFRFLQDAHERRAVLILQHGCIEFRRLGLSSNGLLFQLEHACIFGGDLCSCRGFYLHGQNGFWRWRSSGFCFSCCCSRSGWFGERRTKQVIAASMHRLVVASARVLKRASLESLRFYDINYPEGPGIDQCHLVRDDRVAVRSRCGRLAQHFGRQWM
jgi:hypothetical protein